MVGRRLSALVDLCEGNSLVTDGFSSQRDSNTELCRFCISLSINVKQTLLLRSDELNVYKHTACPDYMVAVLKTTFSDVFP